MRSQPGEVARLRSNAPCVRILAVAFGLSSTVAGCFDGNTLLEAKQEQTNRVRLDEIDLGEFRISLPGLLPATNGGIVEFHAFGHVANRDRAKVAAALKLNEPEFRYRVILAVRSMTDQQLSEPNLAYLRSELAKLANAPLEHHGVKSVGFYRFVPPEHRTTARSDRS